LASIADSVAEHRQKKRPWRKAGRVENFCRLVVKGAAGDGWKVNAQEEGRAEAHYGAHSRANPEF
jgi:hypothetical protein